MRRHAIIYERVVLNRQRGCCIARPCVFYRYRCLFRRSRVQSFFLYLFFDVRHLFMRIHIRTREREKWRTIEEMDRVLTYSINLVRKIVFDISGEFFLWLFFFQISVQVVFGFFNRAEFNRRYHPWKVHISNKYFSRFSLTRQPIDFVTLDRIDMVKCSIPKSLVRTASTGEMNVFLILEVKFMNELMVVSREGLPPALVLRKLVLKQKITVRDSNRQNIELSIIFMRTYPI